MEGLFGSSNWLYIILIGFIVGVLARLLKPGKDSMGIILTILLGIAGALLAGWIGQATGFYEPGEPAGFLGALAGAIVILLVVGVFRRKRTTLPPRCRGGGKREAGRCPAFRWPATAAPFGSLQALR